MGEMKGGLMKLGQMLSLTDDLVLPPEITELFKPLQKDAPPMSESDLDLMLKTVFPAPLDDLFDHFERRPFAQASIGQVHRARLKNGDLVAVKIQYPEIKKAVAHDLKNLDGLDRLIQKLYPSKPDLTLLLEEVRESLLQECDYRLEAQNLAHARELLKEPFPTIRVPRVYQEYSSEHAIVLEFMEGMTFQESLLASQQQKDEWGQLLYDLHQFCFHRAHFLHTDPQTGNYLFNDREIILLDFGSCRRFTPEFVEQYTKLLESLEQQNFDLYEQQMRAFGFFTSRDSRELVREHYQLLSELYLPYTAPGRYPLKKVNPFDSIRPFLQQISLKDRSVPGREFVLLDRAHLGLYTKLRQWEARIDWLSSRHLFRQHLSKA